MEFLYRPTETGIRDNRHDVAGRFAHVSTDEINNTTSTLARPTMTTRGMYGTASPQNS